MGICTSCEATAVVPAMTTKLILADGELKEFDRPVKVSHVLQKNPECFVCDADEMEFDGLVSAVGSDEELRLGQIYFVLPRSMLKHPLHSEDLAALAVKASAALMKAAPCGRSALVFAAGSKVDVIHTVAEKGRRTKRVGGGRGRNFTSDLCAIPE